MADTADVERVLVGLCAGALFPAGGYVLNSAAASAVLAAPPAGGTAAAVVCRLYRGWPSTDTLNTDLAKGVAHVSIYPEAEGGRNATRYFPKWWQGAPTAPTLAATVAQGTTSCSITWSGTPAAGQLAGVLVGPGFAPASYAYAVQATDTPASVAAALAAQIAGASAAGAVLTVANPSCLARVVQGASATALLRQITQRYRVNLWCPSPQARDALAAAIDLVLAQSFRLAMPDGTPALLRYGGSVVSDLPARQGEWNRSLALLVEYSTAAVDTLAAVLFPAGSVNGAAFLVGIGPAWGLPNFIYTDMAGDVLIDTNSQPLGGSGALSPATLVAPPGGYVTSGGAVLVDIFGNAVVAP